MGVEKKRWKRMVGVPRYFLNTWEKTRKYFGNFLKRMFCTFWNSNAKIFRFMLTHRISPGKVFYFWLGCSNVQIYCSILVKNYFQNKVNKLIYFSIVAFNKFFSNKDRTFFVRWDNRWVDGLFDMYDFLRRFGGHCV